MKKIFLLLSLAILPFIMWGEGTQSWLASQGAQILPILHENFWGIVVTILVSIIVTILIMPPNGGIGNQYFPITIMIVILILLLYQSWRLAAVDMILILTILLINLVIRKIRDWLAITIHRVRILGWQSLWRRSRF